MRDPKTAALEYAAEHLSSDWPERCQEIVQRARAALATPAAPAQPVPSALPVAYIVSGKPLVWSKAYDDQWLDEDYGFSIMLERDSETPYNAAWGEGDSEDFATLEEAKAWCQAEIDAWARRSVVVTPAQPSAQGEAVAWLVEWKAHGHGPQWWGFNHTPGKNATWCSDANNAIRFARKEDAERMRLHVIAVAGLTGMHSYERSVSVTEHLWEGYCRAA